MVISSIIEANLIFTSPLGGVGAHHAGCVTHCHSGVARRYICYSSGTDYSGHSLQINVAYSDDKGATWTVMVIPASVGNITKYCAMAIDKNDNIYVIWQMSTGGYFNLYISMCDYATLTWTKLDGVTSGANQLTSGLDCGDGVNPPEVTVDWNNVVHIGMGIASYVSISSIFYTNSTPGEMANWPYNAFSITPPFQVDSASDMSADGLGPSMTVTKDNTVHFVYFGRDLNAGDVCHIGYYRSRSVTGVWSTEYKFYDANFLGVCDGDGLGCVYPSIEVAPDDTLYVVFMGNESGVTPSTNWCCCLVSKTWPAGVWSTRTWFAYDNVYGNYVPKHAIAGNNTMRILWYGTGLGVNPGVTNIYYRDYNINTGVWTPLISSNPVQLTDLAAAQYHCATFANKFRFADSGHDIAWFGLDNNACVKFYGDAVYPCYNAPLFVPSFVFENGCANKGHRIIVR